MSFYNILGKKRMFPGIYFGLFYKKFSLYVLNSFSFYFKHACHWNYYSLEFLLVLHSIFVHSFFHYDLYVSS